MPKTGDESCSSKEICPICETFEPCLNCKKMSEESTFASVTKPIYSKTSIQQSKLASKAPKCENGASDTTFPNCCKNGGSGPFCCENGADNPFCCENGEGNRECNTEEISFKKDLTTRRKRNPLRKEKSYQVEEPTKVFESNSIIKESTKLSGSKVTSLKSRKDSRKETSTTSSYVSLETTAKPFQGKSYIPILNKKLTTFEPWTGTYVRNTGTFYQTNTWEPFTHKGTWKTRPAHATRPFSG